MQKHKFGETCPDTFFMKTALGSPEQEKSALMFHGPDALECTT
jgi:hypothetical protein